MKTTTSSRASSSVWSARPRTARSEDGAPDGGCRIVRVVEDAGAGPVRAAAVRHRRDLVVETVVGSQVEGALDDVGGGPVGQAPLAPVAGELEVDRQLGAVVDDAVEGPVEERQRVAQPRSRDGRRGVHPRPDAQQRPRAGRPQRGVVLQLPGQEDVLPAAGHAHRDPAASHLPDPVGVRALGPVRGVGGLLAQPVLEEVDGLPRGHGVRVGQGHRREPGLYAVTDGLEEPSPQLRVAHHRRPREPVVQGEGAARVGLVAELGGGDDRAHRGEGVPRVRGQGPLGDAEVARAQRGDPAVAPGLGGEPADRRDAVVGLVERGELALGVARAAHRLHDHLVAPLGHEPPEHRADPAGPAVGAAHQHDRPARDARRDVAVVAQHHAVGHRDRHVPDDADTGRARRGQADGPTQQAGDRRHGSIIALRPRDRTGATVHRVFAAPRSRRDHARVTLPSVTRTPRGEAPDVGVPADLAEHMTVAEQHDWVSGFLRRHPVSRRSALKQGSGVVAALGLASSPWTLAACAQAAQAPVSVVGRHIAFGDDPTSSMSMAGELTAAPPPGAMVVDLGQNGQFGARIPVEVRHLVSQVPQADGSIRASDQYFVHALASGLAPGQSYDYRFRLPDGTTTATATFRTAPRTVTTPWSFTAFADQGVDMVPPSGLSGFTNGYYKPDDTRRTMTPSTSMVDRIAATRPAFHLLAGDICYADPSGMGQPVRSTGTSTSPTGFDSFDPTVWTTYLGLIERSAASTPWMFATGNHDMEALYDDDHGHGATHGYGGHAARLDLPRTGPSACPSVYSMRYGNVGVVQRRRQRPLHGDPHERRLLGRLAGGVAAPDAHDDARRPGHRLRRRVLPPLRVRDVVHPRVRRRGARGGRAAVRRVLRRPRAAGPQPPVRAVQPDPAGPLDGAGPGRGDGAARDRRHDVRVRRVGRTPALRLAAERDRPLPGRDQPGQRGRRRQLPGHRREVEDPRRRRLVAGRATSTTRT